MATESLPVPVYRGMAKTTISFGRFYIFGSVREYITKDRGE